MVLTLGAVAAMVLLCGAGPAADRLVRTRPPLDPTATPDPTTVASPARRSGMRRHRTTRRRIAATAGWVALAVIAGVVAAVGVWTIAWATVRTRRLVAMRRAAAARRAALPDAIDTFVLLVHAGLTPQRAVEHLADVAPPVARPSFVDVVRRTRHGEPFADALDALTGYFGPGALALVDLVAAASRYGLPMADVLVQLSTETRASRRRLDEAAARALPVRLSFPLVVCTLPSFVLLAIAPAVLAALSSLGSNAW